MNKKTHFRCDDCGGIFEKEWSEEKKVAEMKEVFGDIPEEERATVCDNCYSRIIKLAKTETPMNKGQNAVG